VDDPGEGRYDAPDGSSQATAGLPLPADVARALDVDPGGTPPIGVLPART
jgi:hypothetical protein